MQVHYFQRYHSAENVTTANTMLMLSRLYNYSTGKFFAMIDEYILGIGEPETPEVKFETQKVSVNSVPDAVISQKSFKIVVETKLRNQFDPNQLVAHLNEFKKGNEDIKVLLTIDPYPMKKEVFDKFKVQVDGYNKINNDYVKHVNMTFKELLEYLNDFIDDRDIDMVSVFDDFKDYCYSENLIPNDFKLLRAVTSGATIDDNIDLNLIYDLEHRNFSKHGYIGLYKKKHIKAIGKVYKIIKAQKINGMLEYCLDGDWEAITTEEINRIEEAIRRGKQKNDYDLENYRHRYFMVEKFYETNFIKNSKGGLRKAKFFDLEELLGTDKLPATEEIAKQLNGKTWE